MIHSPTQRRLRLASAFQAAAPARPANDKLTIREVQFTSLREPSSGRRYTIVRLQTTSGIAGYGECAALEPAEMRLARTPLETPATSLELLDRLLRSCPGLNAAVNMAALDIAARFAGVPLYQYLGGPTRAKVRVMTKLESASAQRPAGFNAFVLPLPARDARRQLDALRAQAGPSIDFVIDASAAQLEPRQAAYLCRDFETFHPYWIDEPCSASNVLAARRLSSESVTPLGFGRTLTTAAAFEDLLREEAIDVLRPSMAVHTLTGIRKLAAMAETRYVAVAPFHDGGPIATAAALHLAASIPNFFIQQIPAPSSSQDREMRAAIGGVVLETPKDGFLELPRGPGLGVNPDLQSLKRYAEESR
jgi:galactonate dehydratase